MESPVDALCLIFVNLNRAEVLKKGFRPFFYVFLFAFLTFFLYICVSSEMEALAEVPRQGSD